MTIFVALLLTLLTFIAVVLPFFQKKIRPGYAVTDEESQELVFKRDTTYAMLKELEFDYKSGVLTEKDYRDLEDKYKKRGISILKDIDSLKDDTGIDAAREKGVSRPANISDEIEDKIASLRQRKPGAVSDEIEEQVRRLRHTPAPPGSRSAATGGSRQTKARYCPQCGAGQKPGSRFCPQCGEQLT